MKEAGEIFRIVGIILLALFVLAVGVPLVLTAAGVALGILGFPPDFMCGPARLPAR